MKKLVFPLLLVLAISLIGCGSDTSAPAASTDTKNSIPAATPAEKVDKQDSNSASQKPSKKTPKYKFRDLDDSGKLHQF